MGAVCTGLKEHRSLSGLQPCWWTSKVPAVVFLDRLIVTVHLNDEAFLLRSGRTNIMINGPVNQNRLLRCWHSSKLMYENGKRLKVYSFMFICFGFFGGGFFFLLLWANNCLIRFPIHFGLFLCIYQYNFICAVPGS